MKVVLVGVMVNDVAVSAGGCVFDSKSGQIGYKVTNGSPPQRRFFGAVLTSGSAAYIGFATHYTLWRYSASNESLIFLFYHSLLTYNKQTFIFCRADS